MGSIRAGRFLCERRILQRPLLYLSIYLKGHRAQYYDRLTAIRTEGDWEGWLAFFLRGVTEVSESAARTAQAIVQLRESARARTLSTQAQRLLERLFEHPVLGVRKAEELLGCSFATANKVVQELETAALLRETTGQKRNRRYRFDPFLKLFDGPGLTSELDGPDAQSRA